LTPEAERYLDKARQCVAHARAILAIEIGDDAGRAAYLGGFHAAQAFIFERTGRVAKTHKGVHSQFLKLAGGEPRIPVELRRFLRQAYDLKTVADYEVGQDAVVPVQEAKVAIETAARFIETVAAVLGDTV
jgi:uncharacterized protein (UPF0332 family)